MKHTNLKYKIEYFKKSFPNEKITDFEDDMLFITCSLYDTYIGIARLVCNFSQHFKSQNNIFLNNFLIDYNLLKYDIYFLTGIFVDKEYRHNGIGTMLIKERLKLIPYNSFIYTDVLKSNYLYNYYLKNIPLKKIFEDKNTFFLFCSQNKDNNELF
jgi:GNAT superfamily N-acetyltransferase